MSIARKKIVKLLLERKLVSSTEEAKSLIDEKCCLVNGKIIENPQSEVAVDANISIKNQRSHVGRGGEKLAGLIDELSLSFKELVCADLGSSTGGFTQQLLEYGAKRVYAVDTAKGELDWSLRSDSRVEVWEGMNAARIESFPEPIDTVTVDVSLVPLREFLPDIFRHLSSDGRAILLVKPQYELPTELVPEGGVINDVELERQACELVKNSAEEIGFRCVDIRKSRLKGKSGNQEYFIILQK